MSNNSLWRIDKNLSGATAPDPCGPWHNPHEGVLHIPQSAMETRHQFIKSHIQNTRRGSLTFLQRCNRYILLLQPTRIEELEIRRKIESLHTTPLLKSVRIQRWFPKTWGDHLILAWRLDLIIMNKKKRPCKIVDFAVLVDHRIKLKECEKKDKYLDLAKELKKTMKHEGDNYTNCDWCFWFSN